FIVLFKTFVFPCPGKSIIINLQEFFHLRTTVSHVRPSPVNPCNNTTGSPWPWTSYQYSPISHLKYILNTTHFNEFTFNQCPFFLMPLFIFCPICLYVDDSQPFLCITRF